MLKRWAKLSTNEVKVDDIVEKLNFYLNSVENTESIE